MFSFNKKSSFSCSMNGGWNNRSMQHTVQIWFKTLARDRGTTLLIILYILILLIALSTWIRTLTVDSVVSTSSFHKGNKPPSKCQDELANHIWKIWLDVLSPPWTLYQPLVLTLNHISWPESPSHLAMKLCTTFGTRLGAQVCDFSACFGYFTKWDCTTSWYLEIASSLIFNLLEE